MTPEELASLGWVQSVGGQIHHPRQRTHRCSVGGSRCLDFFVVDARIAERIVQVTAHSEAPTSPHMPVSLWIDMNVRSCEGEALQRRNAIRSDPPIGPRRKEQTNNGVEETRNAVETTGLEVAMSAIYKHIEADVVEMYDLHDEAEDHTGRAGGPSYVTKNVTAATRVGGQQR